MNIDITKLTTSDLAKHHARLKDWLKRITEEEMSARLLLCAKVKAEYGMKEKGTEHYSLSHTMSLKVVNSFRHEVSEGDALAVRDLVPPTVWNAVFPAKLSLSMKAFDQLDDEQKALLSSAIISKPNKPTVELLSTGE